MIEHCTKLSSEQRDVHGGLPALRDNVVRRIKRVVFADEQRVVLFSWGASKEPRLRNVEAINTDGSTRWIADLPDDSGHDCFVKIEAIGRLLFATTFSGHVLRLCPSTGAQLV